MIKNFYNNLFVILILFCIQTSSCKKEKEIKMLASDNSLKVDSTDLETATFAGGCFWCVEAVFKQIEGVVKVESGYTGGNIENPTYEQVCSGNTGYAEAVQITFDSKILSYENLLDIFWQLHNPTTLNRQGSDIGTQYRSEIFYHNQKQKEKAEKSKKILEESNVWENKIVTKITPSSKFYKAEEYHQDYYSRNTNQPYCSIVILPKLKKVKKEFQHLLKKNK